jgi:hypothetical protein
MIFDFGCQAVGHVFAQTLPIMRGVVACLAVFVGLAALGRTLRRDKNFMPQDILCGWGVAAAFMTLAAISFPQPLTAAAVIVFAAMLIAILLAIREKYFTNIFWIFLLIPVPVILFAINAGGIGKWDDFSHWVPNAFYIFQHNGVPGYQMPPAHSVWPGYPYALPFLTYLASRLAGGFLMSGGAMMNFLMLAAFAAQLTLIHRTSAGAAGVSLSRLGYLGFALLAVTLLNPNFNASFTMTSQGDTATMVVVGFLGLMLLDLSALLAQNAQGAVRRQLAQICVLGILLVLIKQSNLALLGLLVIGFVCVGWKHGRLKASLICGFVILSAAMLWRSLWQHHVDMQIAGNGFAMRPLHDWRWDLAPALLRSMGLEAAKKSGCFSLILIAVGAALVNLFRPSSRLRDFTIITGAVCGGYIVFLMVCYVGSSFSEQEIRRAASFYRYSTQLGLLTIALVWMAAPSLTQKWRNAPALLRLMSVRGVKQAACIFALIALPLSLLVRVAVLIAVPNEAMCQLRAEAQHIVAMLPPDARLAVIEPETDGMMTYVTNFELSLHEQPMQAGPKVAWGVNSFNIDTLQSRIGEIEGSTPDVNAVYIRQTTNAFPAIADVDSRQGSRLLVWNGSAWKSVSP